MLIKMRESSQTNFVQCCDSTPFYRSLVSSALDYYYLWQRKGAAFEHACSFNRQQAQIFARGFFSTPNKNANQQSTDVVLRLFLPKTIKQLLHLQMAIGVIFPTTKSRLCFTLDSTTESYTTTSTYALLC